MTEPTTFQGHNLNNPAEYPARYEADWLRRRPRRAVVRMVIMVVIFAGFLAPFSWQGALVVALLAGGLHSLYVWRRHHVATAWKKDAYAERQSVRVVWPLEKQGYLILHDHFHDGVRIQTLLIGPTGVWLVHAVGRTLQRRLWGDAAFLHPGKQATPPDPGELRDQAGAVGETLAAEACEPVTVRPLYVAFGGDLPDSVDQDGAVPAMAKGVFRDYLRGEPTRLSPEEVDRLAAVAMTSLPAGRPEKGSPTVPPMAVRKSLWSRRRGPQIVRETDVGGRTRRGARRRNR